MDLGSLGMCRTGNMESYSKSINPEIAKEIRTGKEMTFGNTRRQYTNTKQIQEDIGRGFCPAVNK